MAMIWPFDREYMRLALEAGLIVGACAPLIGVFLVQKRLSLLGDGIGHLAFAGVAAGLVLQVAPIWTALVVAVVGAASLEQLRIRRKTSGDLALALFFYSGIAAGVVLTGLAGSLNANIFSYLFGSILTVQPSDVWIIAGLGAVIVGCLAVTGRALFAIVVDEEAARVAGIPVDRLSTLLAVLTAGAVVAAMRVVGVLLVAALMVLPVAGSQQLARSFRATMGLAVAIGLVAVVTGLVAARIWGLAAGGSIVLMASLIFALTSAIAGFGRRGRTWGQRPAPLEG
jgi:zinc transport system permease protein